TRPPTPRPQPIAQASPMPSTPAMRFTRSFMDTSPFVASDEPEQRREHDHHDRGPGGVDRQIVGLPALEVTERAAPAQEAQVEDGGPGQVHQQDYVHAERGHA